VGSDSLKISNQKKIKSRCGPAPRWTRMRDAGKVDIGMEWRSPRHCSEDLAAA